MVAEGSPSIVAVTGPADSVEVDIDSIINRLSVLNRFRRVRKEDQLSVAEVQYLCTRAKDILLSQPTLLKLEAPITLVGDIRGHHSSLLRTFASNQPSHEKSFLFVGGYTQNTYQGIEVMCLCLAYKIKYPDIFFLLRGNHECKSVTRIHGLYDECKGRYNVSMWNAFIEVFEVMPLAATIDEKIFCVHGGLSPELQSMEQIMAIQRPLDVPDHGLVCDLLWSDPHKTNRGWAENDRGVSVTFGADILSDFLEKQNMNLIVRGHQVVEGGYEYFADKRLVTLCGTSNVFDSDNAAATMTIDKNHDPTFEIIEPRLRKKSREKTTDNLQVSP